MAVVAYEERELLGRCLASLEADVRARRAVVWVVDNGSRDGTAEMVRERFPWASLVVAERNLGYGAAVDLVAARTTSEWIAPANQDLELAPDALERLIAAGELDSDLGAVAPRLVAADGSSQHSVHPFPTLWLTLLFNLGVPRLSRRLGDRLCLEGAWDPDRSRAVPWAIAAFLLVRRRAFDQVGGFDPAMWLHAEDLDLAWRLSRDGWRTWYEPEARVAHVGSVSTRKAFGDGVEARFVAASYAWMARRRGLVVTWAVAAVNVAGAASRAALLAPAASLMPRRYAPSRDRYRRWARIHRTGLRPRSRATERH